MIEPKTNPRNNGEQSITGSFRFEKQILNTSSIGVLITRVSDGTILYANKAVGNLLGIASVDSLIGQPVPDYYWDPADRQELLELFRNEGSVTSNETRARQANGNMIWVSISLQPFQFEGEQSLLAEIVDNTDRKQVEDAVKASQQKLSLLIDSSPLAVIEWNTNFEVVSWNPAAERIFGYSFEEAKGRHAAGLIIPAEYKAAVDDVWANLLKQTGGTRSTNGNVTKDGRAITCEWYNTPLAGSDGKVFGVSSLVEDVTERKQAEDAIKESQQKLSLLIDSSPLAVIEWNTNFEVVSWNPAAERIFGYSVEEAKGRHAAGLIVPAEYKAAVDDVWANLLKQTGGTRSTNGNVTKDGRAITCEWYNTPLAGSDGTVFGVSSLVEDVTESKKAEEKALQLQSAVEQTGDGIALADLNGNVLYANPAWAEIHGYTVDDILGKHLSIFHTQEQLEQEVIPFNNKVLEIGKYSSEIGHARKDGSTFPTLMTTVVQKDENGNPVGLIGTIRDITESKKAEVRLNESEARYQLLSEATVEGIVIHDKGILLDANGTFATMFGYPQAEVIGMVATDFLTPETREITAQNIRSGYEKPYQVMGLRKDGTTFPVEITGKVIPYQGRTVRVTALRDITESKKAEQTFHTVADYAYDWEYWLAPDGKFFYMSPSCERISGYKPEEFTNNPQLLASLIHTEDHDVWDEHIRKYHNEHSNESGQVEFRITTREGETRWVAHVCQAVHDEANKWQGRRASNREITEQKQLEIEIQQAFERRGYQVQVSTEISQEIASASEVSDLFERVVTHTKERLGYYHTQLLRYDPAQDAVVLINGYGETGKKMLAGGHKLPLGAGLIGTAAESGQTVMRPTLAEDPDWRPNPLLPETKGEISVPIKFGEKILGVLDVQSDQAGALTEDDRLMLEGLCGQIAIAMQSAELVKTIRENEGRLAEALKTARLANWEYDVEKDLFAFNDQFYSIFHTTAEKAGGYQLPSARYAELFVHPDDMEVVGMEIGKALSSTERVYNTSLDHRFLYQDGGGVGYITVKLTVERDENGKITRYFGANQDITERIKQQNEMAERLEEINRLYRAMSREGWKTYRENAELPEGFVFDLEETRPVNKEAVADEGFASIPMRVLGGEVVGTLTIADDPKNPTSPEDYAFLQQVSDQIALALEGARLSAQTQTALAQSEILFEASRRLAQASDLQDLLKTAIETFNIPVINGAELNMFSYDIEGELESLAVVANWWNGTGKEPGPIGSRYPKAMFSAVKLFLTSTPVFISDTSNSETMDASMQRIVKAFNIHAATFLPLFVGTHQIGVLVMHAEEPHNFTEEETRLFSGLAPQIATVLDNRRQFERAQQQAERETTLNIISQKIQSATTVEAVLQIAARELGHALGAPMTVAQLNMKDKQ